MNAKKLVLIIALATSAVTVVYATQRQNYADALPAAENIPVPQIVVTAKREHGAE